MAVHRVTSPVTGSVWMHSVSVGEKVFEGGQLLVLESMKMEIPIQSPVDGIVTRLEAPGTIVNEGDVVAEVAD
jgi:biotin carboxyl carrier protein